MKKLIMPFIIGLSLYSAIYSMQQPSADTIALLQQHQQTLHTLIAQAEQDQNHQIKQAAQEVKRIEANIENLKQNMAHAQIAGDQPPAQVKTMLEEHQRAIQNLIAQAKNSSSAAIQATAHKLDELQNNLREKMSSVPETGTAIRQRKVAKRVQ